MIEGYLNFPFHRNIPTEMGLTERTRRLLRKDEDAKKEEETPQIEEGTYL